MMKLSNARIVWYWVIYCIVGCSLLPNMVMSARYLPTRRSTPTQLERNERLRELFQHILESERDAHLSAANQFADQIKLIQKKNNNFGQLPDPIRADYTDGFGDEYDETQYDGRKVHLQQQQQHQRRPWRFVLLNYAHGIHRNHMLEPNNPNSKSMQKNVVPSSNGLDDMDSSHSPRSHQQQLMEKLYRVKQQKLPLTNTNRDTNEATNDLDWITSTSELNDSDYDAIYDDVNEKRSPSSSSSSSSNAKFDRYRRNEPQSQQLKQHHN